MTDATESPSCIACGMPMKSADDHAESDPARDYCRHCARPDGSMQSYDEKLASLTTFMVRTQGLDEQAARENVKQLMARLPAWQDRVDS